MYRYRYVVKSGCLSGFTAYFKLNKMIILSKPLELDKLIYTNIQKDSFTITQDFSSDCNEYVSFPESNTLLIYSKHFSSYSI